MANWKENGAAGDEIDHQKPEELFEKLSGQEIKRTVPKKWRGMLPYLTAMAPCPTYGNLSQAALDMAKTWEYVDSNGQKTSSQIFGAPSNDDESQSSDKMGAASSLKATSKTDPLPLSLPAKPASQTGISGTVSVASLPGYYSNSQHGSEKIPEENTFQAAEDLGRVSTVAGTTGLTWFNSTGLLRMQELWETHATRMDQAGKRFIESLETMHALALHEMAQVKSFDLKPILTSMKKFADGVQRTTMQVYHEARKQDDEFGNSLYHTVRVHFERGLQAALEGCESRHREKQRLMEEKYKHQLAQAREANRIYLDNQLSMKQSIIERKHRDELRSLRESLNQKLSEAEASIKQLRTQEEVLNTEVRILRDELVRLRQESKANTGWRARFEKEHMKHDSLKREMMEERRRQVEYIENLKKHYEEMIAKRDSMINRSRDTIFRLEGELLTIRGDAGNKPFSRRSDRISKLRESVLSSVDRQEPPRTSNPASLVSETAQDVLQGNSSKDNLEVTSGEYGEN